MKNLALLVSSSFLVLSFNLFGQDKIYNKIPKKEEKFNIRANGDDEQMTMKELIKKYGENNESVSFGISLGYNYSLNSRKSAQISPIDNALILSDIQNYSFVISSVVSVPISYYENKYYQIADKNGDPVGRINKIAKWSVIGILNLATFTEAQSGGIFNQQISGGFGVSYNINKDVAVGLSYELISYRKPKDFVQGLEGEILTVNDQPVTDLDISNNTYFEDYFANTLSLKLIYKLTTD